MSLSFNSWRAPLHVLKGRTDQHECPALTLGTLMQCQAKPAKKATLRQGITSALPPDARPRLSLVV
jgi:hypothetical protein